MRTLTVTSGPAAGRKAEIERELVVGREGVDIEIPDPEVSRRHAALRPAEQGIELEDLGSANGTHVDGRRIDGPVVLDSNATVRIGGTELRVEVTMPRPEPSDEPIVPAAAVTAPRRIPDLDVTAPRRIPDLDVTAPRRIPEPDVTAPHQVPQPDLTTKREVVAPPEGSPPVPSPAAAPKGRPTGLVVALGVVLVVLLVVLVLLLA